ncbi:hypothetical protein AVEN_118837-1 [Araneus ventricosus]|uniref:Uncharacterized protein n=1 Tax=Araneus ventricosus TaxID=182803 RepID=A0A4Y1ZKA8_ARAVE|nr:hypothetical protein AVEN_118837-1 [Araneus ventricosus]
MSKSTYHRHLQRWSANIIRCPSCLERLMLQEYVDDHAATCHGLKLNRKCVFCLGGERWELGCRDFKHIVPCLQRFMEDNGVRNPEEEGETVENEEEATPCSECKNFQSVPRQWFGRSRDRLSECVNFYESVLERPDQYPSAIEFTDQSGLGRDVYGIVQRYLQEDLQWYHLMVVHENFDNFLNAMEEIRDQMFLLPFWCLCDGLTLNRRTHRHMIIAYEPEAPFKHLWMTRVRYNFADGGRGKSSICIKSAFHLIRTIQYVSQRKASCDGTRIHDEIQDDFAYSHFYINRELHEHAIAWMSTMFSGGMESLLREQNRNKNVVGWLQSVQKIRDANYNVKYGVPVGKTGFKFQKCVLPLAPWYEPTEETTPLQLSWIGNKKLYLRINTSLMNLPYEEWYAHQMAKGNTLWSIRHELLLHESEFILPLKFE